MPAQEQAAAQKLPVGAGLAPRICNSVFVETLRRNVSTEEGAASSAPTRQFAFAPAYCPPIQWSGANADCFVRAV